MGADGLDKAQMLAVAKEVGFSETAFICKSSRATQRLRFFTPTNEVDLCGHATIASWAFMKQRDRISEGIAVQETLAGLLKVDVRTDGLIYMEQTESRFFETVEPSSIKSILGITENDFHETLRPQVVSTGLKDLIVILRSEAVLNDLVPDLEAVKNFSREHDISGMHIVCLLDGQASIASARNFAPLDGIDEESATGTSNGALLCYLKKHAALPAQDEYRIEQGKAMGQTSYIYGKFIEETVWIGGKATVLEQVEVTA